MNPKGAIDFTESFLEWLQGQGELAWVERIPAREAVSVPLPDDLSLPLRDALASRGITSLYSHQAEAYALARDKKHFVVVTPTASGKTLCYNLPVVMSLLEDPAARALYLFPTKALSQDQQAELNEIALGGALPIKVHTYDGDTPGSLRVAARDSGRIVISNPDMLHSGILPNHPKWIRFFSALKYVVVDEMHAYRGVFGSHVANVIRRLRRIAAFYGSYPTFIFCSATIGNPAGLAAALLGEPTSLVDRNGAASGAKVLAFFNPPLVDAVQGIRRSSSTESQRVALELLKRGVKTILFARSRLQVELIASYMTKSLENPWNENNRIRVSPYRSGLLPSERRKIEKELREGSLRGVVSTNALELGIDIGGLDAAVVSGYPGSFASFWQQAGRAGRRGSISLAILVGNSSPLDQYLAKHPEYFLSQKPETARIDPDNAYIFTDHVKCAAFELPFADGETFGPSGDEGRVALTGEALDLLEEEGIVRHSGGRWFWSAEGYPSEKISLRSATADNVVIVDTTGGKKRVVGEMDRPSAKELIFDNAVYIHLGTQYMVKKLDIDRRTCEVEPKTVEYWTDAVVKTDIKILSEDSRGEVGKAATWVLGDVLVRSQAEKYKKLSYHTHENVGYGDIDLPAEEMQTRAVVVLFPEGSGAGALLPKADPASSAALLSGTGRLLAKLAPAFLMCDPRDLGIAERVRDPHFGCPALYLYDMYPGGTGLAEGIADRLSEVFSAAGERLSSCGCAHGCPSCIGADLEPGSSGGVKTQVSALLAALSGAFR
ncbi:MAG: DEAD/DEAH box helicase [Rectinema sp.]